MEKNQEQEGMQILKIVRYSYIDVKSIRIKIKIYSWKVLPTFLHVFYLNNTLY